MFHLVLSFLSDRECKACQKDWQHFQSSCYAVINCDGPNQRTWEEAENNCRGQNAHLVVIESPEEQVMTIVLMMMMAHEDSVSEMKSRNARRLKNIETCIRNIFFKLSRQYILIGFSQGFWEFICKSKITFPKIERKIIQTLLKDVKLVYQNT